MEKDLDHRLIILETKFQERWDAHDQRSEEKWSHLDEQFKEIKSKLILLNTNHGDCPENRSILYQLRFFWVVLALLWATILGVIMQWRLPI